LSSSLKLLFPALVKPSREFTLEAPKHRAGDLTLEAFERLRDGLDVRDLVRLRRASRMADPTREATT
jgi:hypothetical protein